MAAEEELSERVNERWSMQAAARARARAQQRAAAALPQAAAHVAQLSAADAAETLPPRWKEERDKRTGTPHYVRIGANGKPLDEKAAPLLVKPPDFLPQSKASEAMEALEMVRAARRFLRNGITPHAISSSSRAPLSRTPQ